MQVSLQPTQMASASSASASKTIFELSLHGIIPDSQYDQLLTRLDGLCGTSEHQHSQMRFRTWECVHRYSGETATTSRSTSSDALELRLIHEYDKERDCWYCKHVKHTGSALSTRDRKYKVIVRAVHYGKVFSETTSTVMPFLTAVKCPQVFEYVRKGIWFNMRHQNIRIEISKLFKVKTANSPNELVAVDEKNYLVQMYCEAPYDEITAAESSMITLADNLSSIVVMHNEIPKE